MNPNIRRLIVVGAAVIAGVALLAVALPQLWYPLWFDQGALAACADALRRGGALFRDCWEVRGPAAVLAYAIPMLASPSPVAIHAFDLLWQALTAFMLALLARRLFGTRAAIVAAVLYWLMYASVNYWATAQAESFANLFFVLALYTGWRAVGGKSDWRLEIGRGARKSEDGGQKAEGRSQRSEIRDQRSEDRDKTQEVRGKTQEGEGQTAWYAHREGQSETDVKDDDEDDVVDDEGSILESPISNLQSRFSNRQSRFIWLAISGACAGVLFWFKYPFVLIGLVPLGLILARSMMRRRQASTGEVSDAQFPISTLRVQSLLPFLLGGLAVVLIGLACFAISGALPSLQAQITYDVTTFNNVPLSERVVWLRTTYWEEIVAFIGNGNTPTAGFKDTVAQLSILGRGYPFVFALLAIGLIAGLWRRSTRAATLYMLGYFVAVIAISLWQGHFYRYHFLIALPAMALIAAAGMRLEIRDSRLEAKREDSNGERLDAKRGDSRLLRTLSPISNLQSLLSNLLLAAAIIGLAAAMLPWMRDAYVNVVIQQKSAASLYQESKLADYSLLAGELIQRTAPRDRIVIFSDVPAVYVLANRPNGTRFPYLRWAKEAGSDAIRQEYAQEFLDDLTRSRARFFVLTQKDFPWAGADFIELWKSMPAIHDYVESNYHYVGGNGPFLIFQRNSS
ncbi:MAG: glycosyltransferase family 39 protein [Chloroflexi bacterium]|nr:glycosyltransferase family 39 protein [Chloroflexota bacterium]